MKRYEKIEELPKDLLVLFEKHYELEDDESFEDLEEIHSYIIDDYGYGDEPKKKGDWYIGKSDYMKLGKYTIYAQYKRFIKDYDCICDEEFDCILVK
jgi:hypothetical protein